eukprot:1143106-Pelagomonas_calceolata.AAC.4
MPKPCKSMVARGCILIYESQGVPVLQRELKVKLIRAELQSHRHHARRHRDRKDVGAVDAVLQLQAIDSNTVLKHGTECFTSAAHTPAASRQSQCFAL